jgi:hypothetical protein
MSALSPYSFPRPLGPARCEMEATEEEQPRTMRIERVMRAQEITDRGKVVITFQAEDALFRLEMT